MPDDKRLFFYLSEILEDPEATKPPKEIVPYLAWEQRVTLLAAREKAGKSTIASAAVAAVSAGKRFLGHPTEPQTILWVSLEEHLSEISRRFVQFGADPERIIVANAFEDPFADVAEICESERPDVIVWDTLGALADAVSPVPIEPGDSAAWTRIMRHITTLSREAAASIVLHHARKSDGRYRDSTAIGANVDVILEMFGEGSKPRVMKGLGRWLIEDTKVILKGDHFVLAEEPPIKRKVYEFVKKHPGCSHRELREGVDGRGEDITRAKEDLEEEHKIVNKGTETNHAYHVQMVRLA